MCSYYSKTLLGFRAQDDDDMMELLQTAQWKTLIEQSSDK